MYRRFLIFSTLGSLALCLLAVVVYNLTPIHDRLAWRVDTFRVQISRFLNPPEEVIFVPQEQVDAIVAATLTAMAPSASQTPTLPAAPRRARRAGDAAPGRARLPRMTGR